MKESMGFLPLAAQAVGNRFVELRYLGREFFRGPKILRVPKYIDPLTAEKNIAADMIEMLFGIHGQNQVIRANRASITVNRLSRQPVSAAVDDKCSCVADCKSCIDRPR